MQLQELLTRQREILEGNGHSAEIISPEKLNSLSLALAMDSLRGAKEEIRETLSLTLTSLRVALVTSADAEGVDEEARVQVAKVLQETFELFIDFIESDHQETDDAAGTTPILILLAVVDAVGRE